jgi:phosphatidylserine/phosphatidylglycerophosphate/cardiolipin synthase-like enzyme
MLRKLVSLSLLSLLAAGCGSVSSTAGTSSGTGSTPAPSTTGRTFYVFPESDNSVTPLYALVNGATRTIDMTMYALQDTTFTADLVAACKRGVTVRVILDQNNEKSNDTPAFNQLNAQPGCTAVWANTAFQVTHEKSFIVDGTTVAIMSLNLQQQYYSTTRDYALVETDANDIAAIQATFNQDFAAGTTSAGVAGASDFSYQPLPGTDLVWSPTTATTSMLAIINNATKTLYIENEEFSAPNIVSAIAAAASRGVTVIYIGEYSSSYVSKYATVKSAGGNVYYYSSSNGFYIHGKTVVADLGLASEAVYMGSINYSTASLTQNRELGVYITGNTTVSNPIAATIAATVVSDETQSGVTHY